MFGVFTDNQILSVKQFIMTKESDLQLISVSSFDFKKKYGPMSFTFNSTDKATANEPATAKTPLVTDIVPLNRIDTVLVTIEKKRYLVYNYILGEVIKEIHPLRGSQFKACSDFMFDIKLQPQIIFYNGNSIRRVDIQTFEIKKNIDLSKITSLGGFPLPN